MGPDVKMQQSKKDTVVQPSSLQQGYKQVTECGQAYFCQHTCRAAVGTYSLAISANILTVADQLADAIICMYNQSGPSLISTNEQAR